MKDLDYGKEYQYAHSYEGNFENQEFLPDEISLNPIYVPGEKCHGKKNPRRIKKWKEKIFLGKFGDDRD